MAGVSDLCRFYRDFSVSRFLLNMVKRLITLRVGILICTLNMNENADGAEGCSVFLFIYLFIDL